MQQNCTDFIAVKSFKFARFAAPSMIACVLAFAGFAQANELDDINQLIKTGKQAQALTKVDQALVAKPRDPQMRFLKGVIQTELGKPADAITTFTKLTEDYPELPEPYNNLAVLYAGSSQFDKARDKLEMAIKTNPSYSTAHENLGDIYANLANQSYSKALQLGGASASLQPKLTLIRELFTPKNAAAAKTQAQPVTTPTPAVPVVAAPPAVKTPTAPTAPVAAVVAPAAATPVAPSANTDSSKQIESAVQAWASAWAGKNMGAYLGAYGKGFTPAKGQSRSEWEEERRERIMGKSRISVKVNNLQATVHSSGNAATVKFRQDYAADALSTSGMKTLEMAKIGERWLIVKEHSGS